MIHAILVFNNDGRPRLVRFYNDMPLAKQQSLLRQVHALVSKRSPTDSCMLHLEDAHVVYRHYATLYFALLVDEHESPLAMLDLIQVFVQTLNACFADVCELDVVFHWEVVAIALGEMIEAGMVVETSLPKITAAVDLMNGR